MRIGLKELCGIESKDLVFLSYPEASTRIIDACVDEKQRLAKELVETNFQNGYEELSTINYKIMYLDRAINSRIQDLEESGVVYVR